jgi:hypothetical protein
MQYSERNLLIMPLDVRPTAIYSAVIAFFGVSFIGWFYGLSPFTCCKRALAAAVLAYIVAALAVKLINVIIIDAIIDNQMNKKKENTR